MITELRSEKHSFLFPLSSARAGNFYLSDHGVPGVPGVPGVGQVLEDRRRSHSGVD